MQHTIDLIKKVFENHEWPYQQIDDETFKVALDTDSPVGTLECIVGLQSDCFLVYYFLSNKPERAAFPRVAEFLHRANSFMPYGNFEFDYSDGEIRHKVFTDTEYCPPSYAVVENAIYCGAGAFAKYGNQLMRVMYGTEDVEQLYLEACKDD